jgi:maltose phosphorylase
MLNLFEIDEWKIIENKFDPTKQEQAESIFSIGNGSFGQRANFEEDYSGKSLQGSYVGGVYYPDKTRVGWWKNGYPEYFAKVLNACNWVGIRLELNDEKLDLSTAQVRFFYRELDMFKGTLTRKFKCVLKSGQELEITSIRFCSMHNEEIAAIQYTVTPLNFSGNVKFTIYLDNNVTNSDANYDEFFWMEDTERVGVRKGVVSARTKKTNFLVATAMRFSFWEDKEIVEIHPNIAQRSLYIDNHFEHFLEKGKTYTIKKYVSITSTLNHSEFNTVAAAINNVTAAYVGGFDKLYAEHINAWAEIWKNADIVISGDESAQQAIRFNIFQLFQTYTGKNPKLNIGPKGFTGEKYGGATYWDTEAYCIPFYLKTAPHNVARQLLKYRYNQLDKAIENAEKLGFKNGAALFPMVTMNGEECHNEWEITFEEIHRNGAIAFAIFNYVRHTNDWEYVEQFGIPVVNAIARFWAQRFNWSADKNQFVMLGVTGPNEYENNINNNWYTSYIARWCLNFALELHHTYPSNPQRLEQDEVNAWKHMTEHIYLPKMNDSHVFLQQDGFLDKVLQPASEIPVNERPINQHWSWDRILRSPFIKQADVLQGIYLFEDHFTQEEIEENFNFYEPMTVHESSLSSCIHSIIAAKINQQDKAYEMYLRTSRLDLDDYNKEVAEGLHITSMAGTWMSIVEGMAGVRVHENVLMLNPIIPKQWNSYTFQIFFQKEPIKIEVKTNEILIQNSGLNAIDVVVYQEKYHVVAGQQVVVERNKM